MENTLKKLQEVQVAAFEKGVHSFNICGWNQDVEDEHIRVVYVTIFREQGVDGDENYFSADFREGYRNHEQLISEIKNFLNM